MVIVLALVLTLALAGLGAALVRAYAVGRLSGLGGDRPLGRPPVRAGLYQSVGRSTLFGGRRWAIIGCYSVLAMTILTLLVVDGVLLFVISVTQTS